MSKVSFEFNLPEETHEFKTCSKAVNFVSALCEIDQWLRQEIKYNDREDLQEIRDKVWEICSDNGVYTEDLS